MSAKEANFGLETSKGVIAKFVMAIIGLVGSIVFARVLGPSGYGLFYLILSLISVLDNPITGWATACKKRISEADFPVNETLGSGLLGALLLSLFIIPFVYFTDYFIGIDFLEGMVLPFSIFFIIISVFRVVCPILSARENFSASEWADTIRSAFTTPLQLILVAGFGMGTLGMIYGLTAATLLTIPYVLYQIGVKPKVPSRGVMLSIASYAKYSVVNGFIGTALSKMDILLLGTILSSSAVGKYQVAMNLTMAGAFIGEVAASGLMPRISNHWSQKNRQLIIDDLTNSLGYASTLAIPIFFGATAIPEPLVVTIFGSQYQGIAVVLVGLAFYRLLSMQSQQLNATVGGLDRPEVITKISVIVLFLNVSLGYLLLIKYGIAGVVFATVISEVVRYIALAAVTRAHLPEVSLLTPPFLQQLLSGLVMFIVVDSYENLFGISWWGELITVICLGAVIYFSVLTLISKPFRSTASGIISDVLSRKRD